ncbi:hypothetical protein KIN20_033734 [Parelaphostrongylus tenuis]|uniref:Uncharacterized protein n=1 Tax=Parelaphostrongylus tenuis TaxID=148309 RepID=A0AAD5WJ43_PARTN|nr:hypothetical protein KIN20_033734 [Parelaphostrongylus tenuis]
MVPKTKQQKHLGSLPISSSTHRTRASDEHVSHSDKCVHRKRTQGGIFKLGAKNSHLRWLRYGRSFSVGFRGNSVLSNEKPDQNKYGLLFAGLPTENDEQLTLDAMLERKCLFWTSQMDT